MVSIGLSGGIGSGKSTVAAMFAQLGATVIDSDAIAREVVEPGTPGLAAVVERFGPDVLSPDGSLNRPKLGQIVFGDSAALADLNAIVHPLVRTRSAELQTQAGDVVVHDIPLLVEGNMASGFDAVVIVQAPLELRLERLQGRGMDAQTARSRIAAQASDEQRRAVATDLLDNSGDRESLRSQVTAVWQRITRRAG